MLSEPTQPELLEIVQSLVLKGLYSTAVPYLEKLRKYLPEDPTILFSLGRGYLESGDLDKASRCLERVTRLAPGSESAAYLYGLAQGRSGQMENARISFERVLNLNPEHLQARISLGVLMQLYGFPMLALQHLEKARSHAPDNAELNVRLGRLYIQLNEYQMAACFFDKALQTSPEAPEALCGLASLCVYRGDAEGAYRLLSPLLSRKPVSTTVATTFAGVCRPLGRCDEAKKVLEECLDDKLSQVDQSRVHFSLGEVYDRVALYDQAFEHFRLGNELAGRAYDPMIEANWFREIITRLNREFFLRAPRASVGSQSFAPVFIVGMPRSGTTLVEQILSCHPDVHGCGELTEIPAIAETLAHAIGTISPYPNCIEQVSMEVLNNSACHYLDYVSARISGRKSVTIDKMPDNYRHLGLIQLMFPDARVIHCRRNPLDNCLSCFFQYFSSGHFYSYDLKNLGMYYNLYIRLMSHWRMTIDLPILDIFYEDLVSDQEQTSRRLIEFCGLQWDAHCMNFHVLERDIMTASYDQVRQPLYQSSVGRWKNYEKHLDSLREGLSQRLL